MPFYLVITLVNVNEGKGDPSGAKFSHLNTLTCCITQHIGGCCSRWCRIGVGVRSGFYAFLVLLLGAVPVMAQEYPAGQRAYERGDLTRAVAIWRPLAKAGLAKAQYALGVVYERGDGDMAAAPISAAKWYRRAAAQGHTDAQTNLARMLAAGRGVPQDVRGAVQLWRRAARRGHPVAQYNLALSHYQGQGTRRDPRKSLSLFRDAAHRGLPAAQFALGTLYRQGASAIPVNRGRALAWFERAARNGHTRAREEAARLRDAGVGADPPPPPPGAAEQTAVRSQRPGPATGGVRGRSVDAGGFSEDLGYGRVGSGAENHRSFGLWIGTMPSRDAARRRWQQIRSRLPHRMRETNARLRHVNGGSEGPLVRLVIGPFASEATADRACGSLRRRYRAGFCQVVGWEK